MENWVIKFIAIASDMEAKENLNKSVDNLSDQISKLLESDSSIDISLLGTAFEKMENGSNIGRCAKCGAWVTDYLKPYRAPCTTDGEIIDGQWLCEVCMPKDNDKSVCHEQKIHDKVLTVPDFTGISLEDIIKAGYHNIFKIVFDTAQRDVLSPCDVICDQTPETGTKVALLSMITLTISPRT